MLKPSQASCFPSPRGLNTKDANLLQLLLNWVDLARFCGSNYGCNQFLISEPPPRTVPGPVFHFWALRKRLSILTATETYDGRPNNLWERTWIEHNDQRACEPSQHSRNSAMGTPTLSAQASTHTRETMLQPTKLLSSLQIRMKGE